ncbi:MAG: arginase [Hyphomicrobiales bacterium]|nr:MAG: arginase [Hyphomicrobiales bacterium]
MTSILKVPSPGPTFFGCPVAEDLDKLQADIAILGIPVGYPYSRQELHSDQSTAPAALRAATVRRDFPNQQYDFDVGGTLFRDKAIRMVDCGDVLVDEEDLGGTSKRAETTVRKILKSGALPIIVGGDHSIPIPVLRAFDAEPAPVTIIQIDAHMDWRDELNGVSEGFSSPMRRLSEMAHVGAFFQIGLRGQGSARTGEIEAAMAYGATIVSAYDVHEDGMQSVLDKIPDGGRYYITLDADGMDPSVMPAVGYPAPGGLTYHQLRKLLLGLVGKGRVVGMDIVELSPSRDINGLSMVAASRVINMLVGGAVRAGYFDK